MKKIVLLLIATSFAYITNAGVGVLVNSEYNKHELPEFQQGLLNSIKLDSKIISTTQPSMINLFKDHIKTVFPGESFEDVVRNSIVELLPSDFQNNYKVGYLGADNTGSIDWFARNPYTEKGPEYGLNYKGKFWASKYCWNPIFPLTKQQSPATQTGFAYNPPNNGGSTNNPGTGVNINLNTNQQGQNVSWEVGYDIYSKGRGDRSRDMVEDIMFAKMAASLGCNNCGSSSSQGTMINYAQPSMVAVAQVPVQQSAQNSTVIVRNRANGWEVANTVLNGANTLFNGINTFRGVRLEGNRNLISNSGYSNTWGGNNGGGRTVFQDSNQLISSNTGGGFGGGNSTVSYGGNTNTW
jgi:hypothetical protein